MRQQDDEYSIEVMTVEETRLRRRIKNLEKQMDEHVRTLERICGRLNIKYKKLRK